MYILFKIVLHGLIIFYICFGSVRTSSSLDEYYLLFYRGSLSMYGTMVYTILILIMNAEAAFSTKTWTIWNLFLLIFAVGAYFLFIYAYSYMVGPTYSFYQVGKFIFHTPYGWLETLFCFIVVVIIDNLSIYITNNYYPLPVDVLRRYDALAKDIDKMDYHQQQVYGTKLSWDFLWGFPISIGKKVSETIESGITGKIKAKSPVYIIIYLAKT